MHGCRTISRRQHPGPPPKALQEAREGLRKRLKELKQGSEERLADLKDTSYKAVCYSQPCTQAAQTQSVSRLRHYTLPSAPSPKGHCARGVVSLGRGSTFCAVPTFTCRASSGFAGACKRTEQAQASCCEDPVVNWMPCSFKVAAQPPVLHHGVMVC